MINIALGSLSVGKGDDNAKGMSSLCDGYQ